MSIRDFKFRIYAGDQIALGPGKVSLLEAIARTGSISAAARVMNMSYRRAWSLVEVMNQSFQKPLVETLTGGSGGGGATLTEFGAEVVKQYRGMEIKAQQAVAADMRAIERMLVKPE